MKPTTQLKAEHAMIRRVLHVSALEASRLEQGGAADVQTWRLILQFTREFTDRCHHQKEEKFLFPLLAARSNVIADGPIKVLKAEHESGRYFMGELERAIREATAGHEADACRLAARALRLYSRMLHRHIEKEEGILFLVTEVLLSNEQAEELAQGFESVEKEMGDAHDCSRQLVAQLEQQSLAPSIR